MKKLEDVLWEEVNNLDTTQNDEDIDIDVQLDEL